MKKLILSLVAFAMAYTSVAQVTFYVNPPSVNTGNYSLTYEDAAGGDWAMPDLIDPANSVEDTLVIVQGVDSLGCDPLTNGPDVSGHIAMIWRGGCQFGTKALNAQNAGAIAVVIVNNGGEPVGMGGGTDGPNVTIPVVMISTATGQLLYDEIMGGNDVSVFIGNKQGYFENDLGIGQKDVLRARQFALPIALAQNDTEFSVPVGGWIFNYGSNDQTNVALNVKVSVGGNVLYDETSTPAPLASGDSVWIPLPTFSEASYVQDYYTMEYTTLSDSVDQFTADDALNADFVFTDDKFAYASLDQTTQLPNANRYVRSASFTTIWGSCIHFSNPNANRKIAKGLTFSATSETGSPLTDEIVSVEAYEWNDAVTDLTDPGFSISTIDFITSGEFTYAADDQNVNMYVPFDDEVVLQDNQNYIFCASTSSAVMFLGHDSSLDYDENILGEDASGNVHGDGYTTALVSVDNAFSNGVGFGTDDVASVMLTTIPNPVSVEETEVEINNAYPNPANESITVLVNGLNGPANLTVVNLEGKVVLSQAVNINGSKLTVDVSDFAGGMYVFNLSLENGKTTTFNVVVSK